MEIINASTKKHFEDIAKLFDGVSAIERAHEEVYKTLHEKDKNGCVLESQE